MTEEGILEPRERSGDIKFAAAPAASCGSEGRWNGAPGGWGGVGWGASVWRFSNIVSAAWGAVLSNTGTQRVWLLQVCGEEQVDTPNLPPSFLPHYSAPPVTL